jgi:hypothetical protein
MFIHAIGFSACLAACLRAAAAPSTGHHSQEPVGICVLSLASVLLVCDAKHSMQLQIDAWRCIQGQSPSPSPSAAGAGATGSRSAASAKKSAKKAAKSAKKQARGQQHVAAAAPPGAAAGAREHVREVALRWTAVVLHRALLHRGLASAALLRWQLLDWLEVGMRAVRVREVLPCILEHHDAHVDAGRIPSLGCCSHKLGSVCFTHKPQPVSCTSTCCRQPC